MERKLAELLNILKEKLIGMGPMKLKKIYQIF